MIIIYILAAIGGLCVLSALGLIILIIAAGKENTKVECMLTGKPCEHEECTDCPIAAEFRKTQEGAKWK